MQHKSLEREVRTWSVVLCSDSSLDLVKTVRLQDVWSRDSEHGCCQVPFLEHWELSLAGQAGEDTGHVMACLKGEGAPSVRTMDSTMRLGAFPEARRPSERRGHKMLEAARVRARWAAACGACAGSGRGGRLLVGLVLGSQLPVG